METQSTPALPANIQSVIIPAGGIEPLTYSVAEAAQVLGLSNITVYRLIARRLLRPLPHVRHKRIPRRQVRALVDGAGAFESR